MNGSKNSMENLHLTQKAIADGEYIFFEGMDIGDVHFVHIMIVLSQIWMPFELNMF